MKEITKLLWVTRDSTQEGDVQIQQAKPKRDGEIWQNTNDFQEFTPERFKANFGFLPRKGSCNHHRFTIRCLTS